jgi:hypothetical protein
MKVSPTVAKIACVTVVVCVVFPLGQAIFPLVSTAIGSGLFGAIEALLTATLGFGLYTMLFG